ncbi:MBL fold metallo-hydrolase [Erysipelothrix larvae]|uniref:MBL fold metallo-hydrolase n=1 Tax=Erysipelothrix larvae TaxID=1514105 RepID=A0A0X8H1P2_9FIRM|nr:MBL fold metallo-hydrolase [Erysipelothrix larvae]AMC94450.1 MBL fold metallo-hydrolase [Erysipelothrix larvae]
MELKDRKTRITFHAGVLTIGGTVIEINYEGSRIFFDFGTEFRPELKLKDELLDTLIEHRLIPELDVYDEVFGRTVNGANTAVFLSHCHLDHTRMINYLDPQVPLYALEDTKRLIELLNQDGTFVLPAINKDYVTREILGVKPDSTIKVGDIEVTLHRVDHDAYGACGMMIRTPDCVIAYTGDLRLHGFDSADTVAFCEKAKNCDMLIMEGVSISFEGRPESKTNKFASEEALLDWIVDEVENHPNQQITFNGYLANVKRFAHIVAKVRRSVVLKEKMAYILKSLLDMDCLYEKDPNKDWGLNPELEVDISQRDEHPEKYLWQIQGFDDQLQSGGIYIHCDADPLGLFDPAYLVFKQQFLDKGIEFNHVGCTGHAFPNDLDAIIEMIQPKCLVPIHTLRPDLLLNPYGSVHLPQRGETI